MWREWNGKYRDTMRDFWRGTAGMAADFATRLAGSSDIYGGRGRRPTSSVNLITVHDGFTLADLVSYDTKHNEANGESNRDGTDDNRSWNSGVEGPSDDPVVQELRSRRTRSMLATLLLSFGIPLVLGGDELGRTQGGNNNAYCQDNDMNWFDWSSVDPDLLAFTRGLVAIRLAHPVFRRRRFLSGVEANQLQWFTTGGTPMAQHDWSNPSTRSMAVYLDGEDDPDLDADGRLLFDDDFLVVVNSWEQPLDFVLPTVGRQPSWATILDTAAPATPPGVATGSPLKSGETVRIEDYSVLLFRDERAGHNTN